MIPGIDSDCNGGKNIKLAIVITTRRDVFLDILDKTTYLKFVHRHWIVPLVSITVSVWYKRGNLNPINKQQMTRVIRKPILSLFRVNE